MQRAGCTHCSASRYRRGLLEPIPCGDCEMTIQPLPPLRFCLDPLAWCAKHVSLQFLWPLRLCVSLTSLPFPVSGWRQESTYARSLYGPHLASPQKPQPMVHSPKGKLCKNSNCKTQSHGNIFHPRFPRIKSFPTPQKSCTKILSAVAQAHIVGIDDLFSRLLLFSYSVMSDSFATPWTEPSRLQCP